MGCRRSPFLNMGTTLAVVQSVGIIPCFSEAWKSSQCKHRNTLETPKYTTQHVHTYRNTLTTKEL